MKVFIFLSILLSIPYIGLRSQPNDQDYGLVYYERILNYDGNPSSMMYRLLFSSDFSVFFEDRISAEEGMTINPSTEDEFDLSFNLKLNGDRHILLADFRTGSIQSQVTTLQEGREKTFIINESIVKINWRVENEYKMINNMKVQKATTEFRGRTYVAWFSSDIPVKYGPWKLHGLPGLILSVADDRDEVMFQARSIKIPLDSELVSKEDYQFRHDAQQISLGEYLKMQENMAEEFKRLISSKLPRGAKIELTKGTSTGIELKYEDEAIR